jgi:two-component system, chemotaxis family, protein-glutamate methylesterase/glutaminase
MTSKSVKPREKRERPAERLIAIGASAGGVEAVTHLVASLPGDLPAAVVVVLHHPAGYRSHLAYLLDKAGPLPAAEARDGSLLASGRILVASPGRHLVLQAGRARLLDTAAVNRVKPSIDLLFLSGAREYGPRLVAVVLSGTLSDGSAGLVAVRRSGGVAVVQDPHEALFWDMPWNAIDAAGADYCVPVKEMATLLDGLVRTEVISCASPRRPAPAAPRLRPASPRRSG